MSKFVNLDLEFENGRPIHMNSEYLKAFKEELIEFLDGQDYMFAESFAKNMMMSQEIKSNNNIEGINDDLSIIDEVIKNKEHLSSRERKRIINLYHGYQYILTHRVIDKEHLRELYTILSNDILESYDIDNMGEYYRTKPVYIIKGTRLDTEPYQGMNPQKIDYYMNQFFEYVNNTNCNDTEIDYFIKSQIMHFYFVYIHPYFDVNGRTSRTVAMWYLLNNKSYPYIIFNRAISFSKREYEENIIKGRSYGDITLFLKYMLINVEKELEKEYLIHSIIKNSDSHLSREDSQMIEYLLSMKGNITAKNLSIIYNNYNEPRKLRLIFEEKIVPLLDKKILINKGYTKGYIGLDQHNLHIGINPDIIDIDKSKVKHLSLDKFIR